MEHGNFGDSKSVGGGVQELRMHFGSGYRIYYGRDGDTIIILLGGGSKRRQSFDIAAAVKRWADYRKTR
jgi:putative addiction module killer protein